ncbi:MAG: hypothetical protein WCZ23_18020 [Rhodospirillaceae bacterium]|jgi:hypothetical protein|uniref:hypothetical protein n=1 Tax=Pseudodonghicola sp. TaxID=1969463 RepID=UPI003589A874
MKRVMIAAALLGALASQAAAEAYKLTADGNTLVVSCFRGPWKDVIWDRPNANFIDSLIDFGYDYPTAQAIGQRICRDERLVDNLEGMKQEMIRIYYESPQYHGKTRKLR